MVNYLRLSAKRPDAMVEGALKQVITSATAAWNLKFGGLFPTATDMGRAPLRPGNLNLTTTNGQWTFSVVAGWQDLVAEGTLPEDQYVILEGVQNLTATPKLMEIKITAGGTELPVINLQEMYALDMARGFFNFENLDDVIKISPEQSFKMRGRATGTNTTEQFGLVGTIIAKRFQLLKEAVT